MMYFQARFYYDGETEPYQGYSFDLNTFNNQVSENFKSLIELKGDKKETYKIEIINKETGAVSLCLTKWNKSYLW